MSKRRMNIGLFVGDIGDDFSRGICKGAMQAAEELDVNLLIFPGKYFDRDYQVWDGIKYEYQHNTLFTYVFPEEIDLLIITIGSIGYLSTGKRRKAFLDYFSAIPIITIAEELKGYQAVMYDNAAGIKAAVEYLLGQGRRKIGYLTGSVDNFDSQERLDAYCETLKAHGMEAEQERIEYTNMSRLSREPIECLLNRNPDLDAIVCVNDEVAFSLYEVLKERGIQIGEDIAVIGYDDLSYAYKLNPPLATIRAEASVLGWNSVMEGVQSVLNNKPVTKRVPVEFIPRASAGGSSQYNEVRTPLFDTSVEKILADNHAVNMIVRDMFNFDKFVDQNFASLLERLYMLEIENCYLYLFPKEILHLLNDKWIPPKEVLLKACLCDGRVMAIPRCSQKYPVEKIYSHEYMPKDRRYTMILLDLFTTDTQHGLVLMEMKFDKHYYLEILAYQMSAAVRMLRLMQTQEEIQKQLEESLIQLKEHNIQLDNESKKDGLTKLLNRHGFEMRAEETLRDGRNQGKYLLAVYADMDNLKIVNDRFGHKEGDFALKSIAGMLNTIFEKEDIIGRIGGDEFAILALREEPVDMKVLRKRVAECIEEFNKNCEKSYYIKMTIGGYTQNFMLGCKLSNILENADDDLYEAKKQRTKDIMKPEGNPDKN